jgi:hypothetical protein
MLLTHGGVHGAQYSFLVGISPMPVAASGNTI